MANNTAFILSHYDGRFGGLDTLRAYVKERGYRELVLLHPLDDYSKVKTLFVKDSKNKLIRRKQLGILNLFLDTIISIYYIRKNKFDLYIGASNFDVIPAIIARNILMKKINRIIYYPRDYSESRFNNKLLNYLYYSVEGLACKYSDLTVSNTKRAESKRLEHGLIQKKSIIIPNPVQLNNAQFKFKNIDKSNFTYVGDVSEEHGLFDLVEILSPIIKKLTVIGTGNDLEHVRAIAKEKGIKIIVHENESHEYVLDFLKSFNGIGLAPYNLKSKWTYYCSPLKIGEYISSGVPVLTSDVPEISEYIKKHDLGVTYNSLNFNEIKASINQFDTSAYEKKAHDFYKSFNVNKLYRKLGI